MSKGFDLASVLGNVSKMDTGPEHIEYIDIDLIDDDPNNFYVLSELDALATNIELIGLQQPLRVRDGEDGRVVIVSGHRRRAAIRRLVADGREDLRRIPCIREVQSGSSAMQELRLIYANSDTRKLTSAELSRQAERVEELLYQLQEEGYEFPGRMRDHVAEACNISRTKLARLKVIRDGLKPANLVAKYNNGQITEQAAYALARLPENVQEDVASILGDKYGINGTNAEHILEHYESWYAENECPKGGTCDNVCGRIKQTVLTQYSWQVCKGTCCIDCYNNRNCRGICEHQKKCQQASKEKDKKEAAKRAAEEAKRKERLRLDAVRNAGRLLKAMQAADVKEIRISYELYKLKTVEDAAKGIFNKNHGFYMDEFCPRSVADVKGMAKKLKCSADYILGFSDSLDATTAAPTAPAWRTAAPDEPVNAAVGKFRINEDVTINQIVYFDGERWHFAVGCATIDAECVAWYPIPED